MTCYACKISNKEFLKKGKISVKRIFKYVLNIPVNIKSRFQKWKVIFQLENSLHICRLFLKLYNNHASWENIKTYLGFYKIILSKILLTRINLDEYWI